MGGELSNTYQPASQLSVGSNKTVIVNESIMRIQLPKLVYAPGVHILWSMEEAFCSFIFGHCPLNHDTAVTLDSVLNVILSNKAALDPSLKLQDVS